MALKFVLLLVLLCPFPQRENANSGIDFFKGSFNEALQAARQSGKPLLVDVYADWCGPCKKLKRETFRDREAAAYFNKNFVCYSLDGETPDGIAVRQLYTIRSYPTLLILDGNGKLLTKTEGFMKPYILMNFGRRIVP